MTKDFDDAAIKRVARWLCLYDGNSGDEFDRNKQWQDGYAEDARKVVSLLTQPPDAV